ALALILCFNSSPVIASSSEALLLNNRLTIWIHSLIYTLVAILFIITTLYNNDVLFLRNNYTRFLYISLYTPSTYYYSFLNKKLLLYTFTIFLILIYLIFKTLVCRIYKCDIIFLFTF